MRPTDNFQIDWTGVQPDQSPIAPLNSETFVARLRLLSERAEGIEILRKAFNRQQSHGQHAGRPQDLLDIAELENIKRRLDQK